MGQAAAPTGVLIRTGPSSASSARYASGLVLRFGAFDYVIDNTLRFRGGALPPRGIILPLGSHRVFVTSVTEEYPWEVQVFSGVTDPLPTGDCSVASGGSTSAVTRAPATRLGVQREMQLRRLQQPATQGPATHGMCCTPP